jgi:hypothetical protein
MSYKIYGMAGVEGSSTFEINNVASSWTAVVADATASVTPITVSIAVAATADSTETCKDGEWMDKATLTVGATAYSAGVLALSIYNVGGSETIISTVDLTKFAANEVIEFPINKANSSGFDGVFRASLTGTPADGSGVIVLDRRPAPAV